MGLYAHNMCVSAHNGSAGAHNWGCMRIVCVSWIGGGCGPLGRKVDVFKIRWKTITCPGAVWLYGVKCQIVSIFVCEGCEKPAAGCEIFRKSILRPFRASAGKMRCGNGFRALKSIFWWNLSLFWEPQARFWARWEVWNKSTQARLLT